MAFIKGTSGNVKGRKVGIPDRRTELRELLKPHAPALLKICVELALSGDIGAMKLCLDRITPAIKPTAETISIPMPAGSLADQGKAILEAASTGIISLDEARGLTEILTGQIKLLEFSDMESRIAALEKLN